MFDGQNYQGASYTSPGAYTPLAPAVGDVLSNALVASYLYSREHARRVGHVIYPRRDRFGLASPGVVHSTYVDIARFVDVDMPAHFTTLRAVVWVTINPGAHNVTYYQRLVVDDGTDTDIGTVNLSTPVPATAATEVVMGENYWLVPLSTFVDLDDVATPSRVNVRVQAYALDGSGDPFPFAPRSIAVYRTFNQ